MPILADMDMALDNIVPESLNWRHTDEGPESVSRFRPNYSFWRGLLTDSCGFSDSYVS